MGSSYSFFVARREGTKTINHQEEAQKHVFTWNIYGFTSLLELGEGSTTTSFNMLGILWKSWGRPSDKHMSLELEADELHPNYMLETKVKFVIHDQRHGKHIEREVSHTYFTTSPRLRVSCMIPLKTLQNPSLGFLLDDSIAVSVELIEFKKVPCNGVEMRTFVQKDMSCRSLFSWYIEDFSQLSSPFTSSKSFKVGGYTWRLRLHPESDSYKNYIAVYLKLDDRHGSQLPPSSGMMVDIVLSIKRQTRGVLANDPLGPGTLDPYQKKLRFNFTPSCTIWGCRQFIQLDDFKNPSNGYLINGRCTIEASVCILGFGNDRSS